MDSLKTVTRKPRLRNIEDCQEVTINQVTIVPEPFVLGESFLEGDIRVYSHTSGDFNPVTAKYIVEAKADLPNYTTFDPFDWKFVTHNVWLKDTTTLTTERYDIFSGDTIKITDRSNSTRDRVIFNFHANTRTSDLIIEEFNSLPIIGLGEGTNSVQLLDGVNIYSIDTELAWDVPIFGIANNAEKNGPIVYNIGFDNIATDFELYIKVTCIGDPTARVDYPELSTYIQLKFAWTQSQLSSLITTAEYTGTASPYSTYSDLSFVNSGDFRWVKFTKTPAMSKIVYEVLALNFSPDI